MTAPATLAQRTPPPPAHVASATAAPKPRFDAPDLVRGLVMVIMLLDHTRDFVHAGALQFDPTDLTQTTVPLFLTRWITHFCAPLFVFLAGMAAAFQLQRGKSVAELSAFLFKRGVWLCVLEVLVIRALMFWQFAPTFVFLQVIWALGVSMICLAVLVRLTRPVAVIVGAAILLGHNVLDGVSVPAWNGPDDALPTVSARLWMLLHQAGAFPVAGWPSPVAYSQYPVLPWIALMALGWVLGGAYVRWSVDRRRGVLLKLGAALTVAFVLLRAANVYADPGPWAAQSSGAFTLLSFLNTEKYPPSLLFLLMTVGPGLILLASVERTPGAGRGPLARALITYGRVPLFFYLLQWAYAKTAGYTLARVAGHNTELFFQNPGQWVDFADHGFGLGTTYAVWAVGVIALYLPCRWFARVKARRRDWWLSYL